MLRFRVLGSGSDGNATLVEGGGARVLLDAGLGPRQLAERLQSAGVDPASLDAVLLSHEHGDHARGAPAFSRKWGVPLAGTRRTFEAVGCDLAKLPAVAASSSPATAARSARLSVRARSRAARRRPAAGLRGRDAGRSRSATRPTSATSRAGWSRRCGDCDALLVESNYDPAMLRDGPYPWSLKERILGPFGHLSNGDVARLLEKGLGERCRLVVLAHLSRKNNHPELALLAAEEALARGGRRGVRVSLAGADGTAAGWRCAPASRASRRDRQLRLF